MKCASGLIVRTDASQRFQSSVSRATRHSRNCPTPRVASVRRARHFPAGGGFEIRLAMLAIADTALRRPTVGENAVHAVLRHDLAVHGIHEVEVVRAERARHPQLRVGPMPARLTIGIDRDPIGMRRPYLLTHGVRIGARDHTHVQTTASRHERPEWIGRAEPCTAMVQRNLGRIVGDDAAGAEAGSVCADARKVVEPEVGIEAAGIILDERELRPSHRTIEPASKRVARHGRCRGGALSGRIPCEVARRRHGACPRGDVQKIAPRNWVRHGAIVDNLASRWAASFRRPLARAPRMGHPAPNGEVQRRIGPVEPRRSRARRAPGSRRGARPAARRLPARSFPRRLPPSARPRSSSSSGPKAPASPWPGPVCGSTRAARATSWAGASLMPTGASRRHCQLAMT